MSIEDQIAELEAARCCNSELAAGRALCGCKGAAATALRRLREEAEKDNA